MSNEQTSDQQRSGAADTPRRLADAFVDRSAAQDPMTAAVLGLHAGDTRQVDLSPEGFEALADLARETLAALDRLPATATATDPTEAACARLLRERLTAQLAVHEAGDHVRALRNTNSPIHYVRSIFTLMPTGTEEEWAAVAGRLRAVPGAVAGYRATLGQGIERGLLSAPRQVETVLAQLDAWTGRADGGAGWFAGFVADGPERLRGELDAAALAATAAVGELRDWLTESYLPKAAGTPDAVGLERYLRSARLATGSDVDVAEAYDWAWTEFHRTRAEMVTAAEQVLPGAGVTAAMDHLNEHGHAIKGEEAVRDWLQGVMDEAIAALDGTHFDITGPLRRVESRIAPAGSAAAPFYQGPSLDFSRPGRTYLPTLGRDTFPTWQLVSTWYHEGVPGHHLQLARWTAVADQLSRYQVTLGKVSANVEGWALYAERLMDDLGFLADPADRLGYLTKQMLRVIRVIVDIGMHMRLAIPADSPFHPGRTWTPELADLFLATYQGSPAARRASEVNRYLGWPGQAIGYKLGERAWLQGREAARHRLGPAFDLKTWHMKAISQGSYGLDDLTANLASL
ncbi:hypothetical protein CFP65_1392 [Kitasatospora sp. MMS16-BH015]|uniref:DUF885 domain-containing protein n=1 Tax=Kitasatospora sp. MMS16-BH015 TaxID=2018025 RepID=UPI000CA3E8A6|nr:DUF885 domain-containing protein [Kitasatospora sp. MMS16-BH015]AUG76291.1 hypothetical protein CFP65_1392 [Kitasatospora sp. MMS16-BH015]